MSCSSVTSKGRVTIPAKVYKKKTNNISASFGLLKATKPVSLEQMKEIIKLMGS